jgi:branched-subunit amino acid aminotransferase/4-amino-4-deoxychorismate lyase
MALPAVLALNAQPFAAGSLDAGTVLKRAPRGAYTTARTYQRNSVFEFEAHVARTAKSCTLMLAQTGSPEVASRCAALTSVATLRPLMAESIAAAIECFGRDAGAATSDDAELKITMLITWGERDADASASPETCPAGASGVAAHRAESEATGVWGALQRLKGPSARTVASVVEMLRSIGLGSEAVLLRVCDEGGAATAAPDAAAPALRSTAGSGPADRTARVQQTLAALAAQPFTLLTHVTPLPPRRPPPIRALVAGAPRENAAAKDSEWVRQRQALEASKPAGVEEILLFDAASGAVMEGTQTNVFVLLREEGAVSEAASLTGESEEGGGRCDSPAGGAPTYPGDGAPATATRPGSDVTAGGRSGWVLYTAGAGILEGTVRRLVLEVCASTPGMPRVELRAPRVQDLAAGRWAGAFITSTSRLVLPIDEVAFPAQYVAAAAASAKSATSLARPLKAADADACAESAEAGLVRIAFPQPRPEVLVRLEHLVAEQVAAHSTRVLPTLD